MTIPSVTGLNRSPTQHFLESSWQGKAVQVLSAIAFVSLIYYVASRFIQTDKPPSQNPVNLNGRVETKPDCLKEITQKTWEENIDCATYGLDFTDTPQINGPALANGLKALSEHVEGNMGITNIVIPKGLTLNKVLLIAKDYEVPVASGWHAKIITEFGDIPTERTRVLFFTNSILKDTRNHTSDEHAAKETTIGKKCEVAIQRPNVRDFMAFLILTYLSSPEDDRVRLYSSLTYTRLLEELENMSSFGGFTSSGLRAVSHYPFFTQNSIGVGASGNSQDIVGPRNI